MKLNRRTFLSTAALAAPAAIAGTGGKTKGADGKPLKVCVFADIHYHPGVWTNSEDMSFLEKILARAESERCDMLIHLGDFMRDARCLREELYSRCENIPR